MIATTFYALCTLIPLLALIQLAKHAFAEPARPIKKTWMHGALCPDCGQPYVTDGKVIGCTRTRFCNTRIAIKERI